MSDSQNDRKRELECLRLASELTQLATKTLNLDLKVRFLRMAKHWADQTDQREIGIFPLQSVSYH